MKFDKITTCSTFLGVERNDKISLIYVNLRKIPFHLPTTLQTRRLRGDLIQKFKIEKGLDIVEWLSPPPMWAPKVYRRSQLELIKNCAQRYNFFNNRIASEWNALPDQVINSETVNQFKACLYRYNCHSGSSTVDLLCGI